MAQWYDTYILQIVYRGFSQSDAYVVIGINQFTGAKQLDPSVSATKQHHVGPQSHRKASFQFLLKLLNVSEQRLNVPLDTSYVISGTIFTGQMTQQTASNH